MIGTMQLCLVFFLIRILEFSYVAMNENENLNAELFFSRSFNFDFLSIIFYSLISFVPLCLVSFFNFKTFVFINNLLALLLVIINLALTQFFLTNHSLITAQIFEFSFSEIISIMGKEFSGNRLLFWLADLLVILFSGYLFLFRNKMPGGKTKIILYLAYPLCAAAALLNLQHTYKEPKYFSDTFTYYLGNSKLLYFLKSCEAKNQTGHNFDFDDPRRLDSAATFYQQSKKKFEFCDKEFPFIRCENYSNELGPFFSSSSQKPNIVIIISESLSSYFSGKSNLVGSLTPFTDSLANKALYWENFLSNADRTYGALPNILASMPLTVNERGFINTSVEYPDHKKYPPHQNLISELRKNNYVCNYYYGGAGNFDNIVPYMQECGIDHLVRDVNFSPKYSQKKSQGSDMVWGFDDKTLFLQALDYFPEHCAGKNFLSVFQTLTFHSPYNLADAKYYQSDFISTRLSSLGIKRKQVEKLDNNMLASIFFADDALKIFFEGFRNKPEFPNTIFIITGDHTVDAGIDKSPLKNYHVPLIIYSPLLKRNASFKGLCSHIDIIPSLVGLLKNNFKLDFENKKDWIGEGLDTSGVFRAERQIPLNIFSLDQPKFILNDFVMVRDEVLRIDENLQLQKSDKLAKKAAAEKIIRAYLQLNNYACTKNKIWKKGS